MEINLILNNMVKDIFVYNESYFVVLDGLATSMPEWENLLLLGRVEETEKGSEIVPIDNEEYEDIAQYYFNLQEAFEKKGGK